LVSTKRKSVALLFRSSGKPGLAVVQPTPFTNEHRLR
jgi:hypothetical protein